MSAQAGYRVYPLQLPMSYVAEGQEGKCRTEQIGSYRVSFLSDTTLHPGMSIEVTIDWPCAGDQRLPMQLIVSGLIINSLGAKKTVQILRHQFRNRVSAQECRSGG